MRISGAAGFDECGLLPNDHNHWILRGSLSLSDGRRQPGAVEDRPSGNDSTSKSKFAPRPWIPEAIRAAPDSINCFIAVSDNRGLAILGCYLNNLCLGNILFKKINCSVSLMARWQH